MNNQAGTQTTPPSHIQSLLHEQQQGINRIHEILHSYGVVFGLKVFLSVVLQIACYLLFAFAIYLAIVIPSDFSSLMDMMRDEHSTVIDLTVNIPLLNDFLLGIKITLAVISLPVLICAMLLGRNRRKSARMRKAFQETEVMKANYNQVMATLV